jgi:hypothetical protein
VRETVIDNLHGIDLTDALMSYVRRMNLNPEDAALQIGSGKELDEAGWARRSLCVLGRQMIKREGEDHDTTADATTATTTTTTSTANASDEDEAVRLAYVDHHGSDQLHSRDAPYPKP